MPIADYERLLPELDLVPLQPGRAVHRAGAPEEHAYFIAEGIVSRVCVTGEGSSREFAITGNEGVIGVALFLGGTRTPSRALVLSEGFAYRLAADTLMREFEHDGPLPRLLLRYTQALISQIGQIAVCNRHHTLEQRLCRWILSCIDRLPANEFAITHQVIADLLGVRREGVTEVLGRLQKPGLIHCSRGHIAVRDRRRLEVRACECYAVVKGEYDRLLPPHREVDWLTSGSGSQKLA